MFFLDPLNGGAWPLLVGGVICLVDSVNGRDPSCPVETKISEQNSSAATLSSELFDQLFSTAISRKLRPPGSPLVGFFSAGSLLFQQVRFWATAGL